MVAARSSKSAELRARVGHPIIDVDGHWQELVPLEFARVLDYARQIGGGDLAARIEKSGNLTFGHRLDRWSRLSEAERRDAWLTIPSWWGQPTHDARDFATGYLPRLLYERMDELGIDFSVLYPSQSMLALIVADDEARRVTCRALNTLHAEMFRPYADRLTPAALIPMHTPQEAVDELEYAVKKLGLKAVVLQAQVRRPIASLQRRHPELAHRLTRVDTFGIDSEYDYDPVWAKCVALGVSPAHHATAQGSGLRQSISSYVHGHIGGIAAAGEAQCKSLFLGGVTRRFPTLKFALLEGGVAWGCRVYADLVGHWEKRNARAIHNMDPDRLDRAAVLGFMRAYADDWVKENLDQVAEYLARPQPRPAQLDDFARAGIARAEDIRDRFLPNFYFGCEADDPLNALAFDTRLNPFGAKLRAVFGSDISHWDAPVMDDCVAEAYDLVERELITPEDFRDFMFTNPVRLYAESNPAFFKGTRVEDAVAELMGNAP